MYFTSLSSGGFLFNIPIEIDIEIEFVDKTVQMNASFNGMGKPMPAVVISVARMAVIYVPLSFVLNEYFGMVGIFVAYAITNVLSGILAYSWALASVKEQCEKHAVPVTATDVV